MLILASASPRRAELLRQIGICFSTYATHIDERRGEDEPPEEYVMRLASEKAQAAFDVQKQGPVLGSDTAVVLGDQVFGKPENREQFLETMLQLSGTCHQVMSSVAVLDANKLEAAISVTDVYFRELQETELLNYWQTGEPKDKAGGYAIQGVAASFIERISGSYSGVMGLPLFETTELLQKFGLWTLSGD